MQWIAKSLKRNQRWLAERRHSIALLSMPSVTYTCDGNDIKATMIAEMKRQVTDLLRANRMLRAEVRS